jgi:NAD(P)H-dependent FMN reductase
VYVNGGTFTKQSGGTIYGSNADSTLKNTAIIVGIEPYGHAVYVSSSKKRNTTAGAGVTLNSGTSGGWE